MFRFLSPRACLLLAAALAVAAARAEGDPTSLENLLEVQVESASRYAQSSFDAPALVHVTTREEADALGHMTVADMLDRLPGLYIATDRDYGRIAVRGFERPGDWGSRLLVTVDGLRINDPMYGQALPGTEFPVVAEWVKRLEYVPGPGGSVYGNNALFGVVNAVTLDGADAPGLRLRTSAGSFGSRRMVAQYGSNELFVGLAGYHADGERLKLPELGARPGLRDAENYAALLIKARFGAWQWLSTATVREQDIATAPFGTVYGAPGGSYRDVAAYHQLGWDAGWIGDLRPSVRLMHGYGGFVGHYVYDRLNIDDTAERWAGIDARVQWRGWTNHMVIAGLEATRVYDARMRNYDVQPVRSILDRRLQTHDAGLFVQDTWRVSEPLALTGGLRIDRLANGEARTSPRVALVWRPDAHQAWKLGAARAYRAPNLAERYYEDGGVSQVGNPRLGTERMVNVQASWERALGPATLLTLSAYRNAMSDLIELTPREADGPWIYRNIGSAQSNGIELDVVHRAESQWQWRASVALQRARSLGAPMSNTPWLVAKGHLISPLVRNWQAAVEADALSHRSGAVRVPGMVVWNAMLRYRLGEQQQLGLRVLNAGDRRASDPAALDNALQQVPRPRRSFWLDWRAAF